MNDKKITNVIKSYGGVNNQWLRAERNEWVYVGRRIDEKVESLLWNCVAEIAASQAELGKLWI